MSSGRSVRASTLQATKATDADLKQQREAPRTPTQPAAAAAGSAKKKSGSSSRKSTGQAEPEEAAAASSQSAQRRRSSAGGSVKKTRPASPEEVAAPAPTARRSLALQADAEPAASASVSASAAPSRTSRNTATTSSSNTISSSVFDSYSLNRRAAAPAPAPAAAVAESPLVRLRHDAELGKVQVGTQNDQYIEDISVQFLYKPHTITALLVIVATLVFLAFRTETSTDMVEGARVGVAAASFFIFVLGLLVFPSGPFIRPHPLVWRLAFGVAVVYEIFLIMLLFQTKEHARMAMKFFNPELGVPVVERSYAANCELTYKNVIGAVDVFVLSHFLGWVIKAVLLRDMLICWVVSIQWELIEILFMHMLPNFAECWWDQWILDVLLSNAAGIYLGCRLAKYLEVKEYRWGSYTSIPTAFGKAKRALMQFTPASWTKVEWNSTSTIKRILGIQFLIFCLHLEELNAFFLKHLLWVPPESKLNVVRLIIWAFVATPSLRQLYSYMTDPNCKRIGHQTFLTALVFVTEVMLIVKLSKGEFKNEMPPNIKTGLIVFMTGYVFILVVLMLRTRTGTAEDNKAERKALRAD